MGQFKVLVMVSLVLCFFRLNHLTAQNDSLILKNGNVLVGEVKSMENSVLLMKTPFSKNDFNIKWKEVREIYTANTYLITLDDGNWFQSNLTSGPAGVVYIQGDSRTPIEVLPNNIVYMKEIETGVWSRINASVDIGLNLTKANNQRQFNIQSRVGYLAEHFGTDIFFDTYQTRQDSVATIERKEGGVNFRYFLPDDWYIIPQVGYLSNTEQALKSRISPTLGGGRFLARTNSYYWGVLGGVTMNIETFSNDTKDRKSAELFVGSGINLFDFGDLDLLANVIVYPSLTEQKRVRTDARFNMKYEFFEDFYIKFNLTYNYDNQPAIAGNESDYVFGISLGWEKD